MLPLLLPLLVRVKRREEVVLGVGIPDVQKKQQQLHVMHIAAVVGVNKWIYTTIHLDPDIQILNVSGHRQQIVQS